MRLRYNLLCRLTGINSPGVQTRFSFRAQRILSSSTKIKMTRRVLVAFDFDHTIVDGNTDVVARNLIPSSKIPPSTKELYRKGDWIDYMEKIFEHLHREGLTADQIVDAIRQMPAVPGMLSVLEYLRRSNCEVIIISDSNSVFISTWLEANNLSDLIRHVYTNPASFDSSGQLHVSKYQTQDWCKLSSVNMCKGHVLESHINLRKEDGTIFSSIVYVGDGHNDYCPSLRLSPKDYVFVRSGYGLEKVIKSEQPQNGPVKAQIHMWRSGEDVLAAISMINEINN